MDGNEVRKAVENSDPATEPIDLAQAFKMYNQANAAAAEEPVEDPADGGADIAGAGAAGEAPVDAGAEEGEADIPAAGGIGDGDGAGIDGPADVIEPVDYNPAREQILKGVQQRAINAVREEFRNQQIEMWSINDIYERDENTGRVRFRNPDDPNRDFQSRYEAQQFVDAMNKQITAEFRQQVNQKQREFLQQEAPRLRTIEFAPKYEAMDQVTKDVFDEMIEPYAVRDNSGDVIGFNVNLQAVATQAEKIAARFKKSQPQQQQQEPEEQAKKQPGGPALDIKTGASQSNDVEPKTIGEALKMYDSAKRKKKGN